MSYWTGSGVDTIEIEMCVYCDTCEEDTDEITVYAEGSTGNGTCPKCNNDIEVEL